MGSGGLQNSRTSDADSGRVRMWHLPDGQCGNTGDTKLFEVPTPRCALDLPVDACSLALRPCETQLAVGTGDGVVHIYEVLKSCWVERGRLMESRDSTDILSLAYSPDGMLLAAGRRSGAYTVHEIATAAVKVMKMAHSIVMLNVSSCML